MHGTEGGRDRFQTDIQSNIRSTLQILLEAKGMWRQSMTVNQL